MKSSYGVLIIVDNKILLCRWRKSPFWGLPKGGIEEGESPIDTAVRECWEEIGIKLDPALIGPKFGPISYRLRKSLKSVWVFQYNLNADQIKLIGDKVITKTESSISEVKLFDLEEALRLITIRQKPFLIQYIASLKS